MKIDDEVGQTRCLGRPPLLSDSELVCLAVAQALLGYHSEARWLRATQIRTCPVCSRTCRSERAATSGCAALPLVKRMIRELAMDSDFWFDNHWIIDSTPVPCGMSRPTVQRSNLATGMPIMWALANPKIGEREVLAAMLEVDADLVADRNGTLLISDKGFASNPFEKAPAEQGIELLRPSRQREIQRYGEPKLKKVRQLIESVNDTLKGQLDLVRQSDFAG